MKLRMEQNETRCQAPPESPVLCANNCGFFGSAATMNLCSKCHKDFMLKQEQAKLAASSLGSIVNGSSSASWKGSDSAVTIDERSGSSESMVVARQASYFSELNDNSKVKEGPKRCSTCRKRVGLTGFSCRCGNLFCVVHRYSDKHDCPFDYRASGQNAIAKANPIVKAEKLDKI